MRSRVLVGLQHSKFSLVRSSFPLRPCFAASGSHCRMAGPVKEQLTRMLMISGLFRRFDSEYVQIALERATRLLSRSFICKGSQVQTSGSSSETQAMFQTKRKLTSSKNVQPPRSCTRGTVRSFAHVSISATLPMARMTVMPVR